MKKTQIIRAVSLMSILVLMITSVATTFSSCNFSSQDAKTVTSSKQLKEYKNDSRYGGTLNWGSVNWPEPMNPVVNMHSVSATIYNLIFDSLIRLNSDKQLVLGVSSGWTLSEDGLEYAFSIRDDVTFHDGSPLTAQDVLFSFEIYLEPNRESPFRSNYNIVDRFEAPDDYTFKVFLKNPDESFITKLRRPILPKHLLKTKEQWQVFEKNPIGAGPFKFTDWNDNTGTVILEAYEDHYERRPFLDKVVFKQYRDPEHLWAGFMRQEIDVVQFISLRDYNIVKDDSSFQVVEQKSNFYSGIAYDLANPIFSDPNVRKAITHSINIEEILKSEIISSAKRSLGIFNDDNPLFNQEVVPFEFNPKETIRLLKASGWRLNDQNFWVKDETILTLRMLVFKQNDVLVRLGYMLRQQLFEQGIRVEIVLVENYKLLDEEFMARNQINSWLRLFGGTSSIYKEDFVSTWDSRSTLLGELFKYENEDIQALFEQLDTEESDHERIRILKQIHLDIYNDQPVCFLFYPVAFMAGSSSIQNFDQVYGKAVDPYGVRDWFFKKQ